MSTPGSGGAERFADMGIGVSGARAADVESLSETAKNPTRLRQLSRLRERPAPVIAVVYGTLRKIGPTDVGRAFMQLIAAAHEMVCHEGRAERTKDGLISPWLAPRACFPHFGNTSASALMIASVFAASRSPLRSAKFAVTCCWLRRPML